MVLWIWSWLGIRARLGLHLFHLCQLRLSVAVDGSQVTDLLSWAHTCLWEQEGSLGSCHGFWLFFDRLIGGEERWRSKHHTETGSQVWGLGVQVWMGIWTPRQEWSGLVCFVPGVQVGRVFRGTQLWYIGSRIAVSMRRYNLAMV